MIRVGIAGLAVEIQFEDPALAALASSRYSAFATRDEPALTLRVFPCAGSPRGEPVRAAMRGPVAFSIHGPAAKGEVDLGAGRGEIHASDLFPLDLALRCAIISAAVARGGVGLHAGAVLIDGKAHVFPAPSGRGKSTLTRLCGHELADELVILDARGGVVHAHGTPWNRGRPGSAPVGAVHDLEWGRVAIEPLGPRAGGLLCARNLALYAEGGDLARRAFAAAMALGSRVQATRLAFTLEANPLREAA